MAFELDRAREFTEQELQELLLSSMAYSLAHIREIEVKLSVGDPIAVYLDNCSRAYADGPTLESMKALIVAVENFRCAARN